MTLRPPRALAPRRLDPAFAPDPLAASLNEEIMSEKRDTYVRLMKRLEKALAAIDPAHASAPDLLDTAAEALLHVIIQRELLGLRNTEAFLRQMKVPRAVRFRMGVR